jgi:hypothetical protein
VSQHPRIFHPGTERTAKPRLRVGTRCGADRVFGLADVCAEAVVVERVHRRVMMRMIPDQMAAFGDGAGTSRIRPRPSALEEEGGADSCGRQTLQDPLLGPRDRRPTGMLRVEGERDPQAFLSART